MSLIKQIEDKGCTIAWSPLGGSLRQSILAAGTKEGGGGGFEEYGGELELYDLKLNNSSSQPVVVGKAKTSTRFNCLTWGDVKMHEAKLNMGILAGGMTNGSINLWDPNRVIKGDGGLISTFTKHRGGVTSLQFNPHANASQLLASGSSDSDVFITDISRPDAPQTGTPAPAEAGRHSGDITSLAWNTKVTHILASSDNKGVCIIWDLRNKKPWGQVRDPNRSIYSSVAWNPSEGMHFLTATDDDMRPVIRLYDLRSSMSTPLAELYGHTQGILGISWCPHDPSLIMSCGKDNRTLLWDLYSSSIVYELPSGNSNTAPTTLTNNLSANQFFGAPASSMGGGTRRYDVQWSPRMPAVLSACSFDRKIQVFSLSGAGSARGPKWLRRPIGASFSFGGKLVSFKDNKVFINKAPADNVVVAEAEAFERALKEEDLRGFCSYRASKASSKIEGDTWSFMKILFDPDAREQLLIHLGFDASAIAAEVSTSLGTIGSPVSISEPLTNGSLSPPSTTEIPTPKLTTEESSFKASGSGDLFSSSSPISAEDLFSAPGPPISPEKVIEKEPNVVVPPIKLISEENSNANKPLDESEILIKKALMVGNFEAAVDCCLSSDKLALALLIATYGGPGMWAKTQEAFFKLKKGPFMSVVKSIVKGELDNLVSESSLDNWSETLAILGTYGKSDEFPGLCNQLGERLENERGDVDAASLCYLCAMNVEKTVKIWEAKAQSDCINLGVVASLQILIERVSILLRAVGPISEAAARIGDSMGARYSYYAMILADQGRKDIADKYASIVSSMPAGKIMMDRIFHSQAIHASDAKPPPFPFYEEKPVPKPKPVVEVPKHIPTSSFNNSSALNNNAFSTAPNTNAYGAPAPLNSGYGAPVPTNSYNNVPQNAYSNAPNYNAPLNTYGNVPTNTSYNAGGYGAPSGGYGAPSTSNYSAPTAPATGGKMLPSMTGEAPSSGRSIPVDGFESSAGNPTLAAKYGNAQSVPYTTPKAPTVFNPSSNAPSVPTTTTTVEAPKISAPIIAAPGILPEFKIIVDFLQSMVSNIEKGGVSGSDGKQLSSGAEAVQILSSRLDNRSLSPNACEKLKQLHAAVTGNDMNGAMSIVKKLTEEEWKDEKDWLKGIKFLLQLYQKRFSR